jgi:hypothetical protein
MRGEGEGQQRGEREKKGEAAARAKGTRENGGAGLQKIVPVLPAWLAGDRVGYFYLAVK